MKIVLLEDVITNRRVANSIINYIKSGKVFFYPTDTQYGLGCDASNSNAVNKIRKIKVSKHPFSVVAPSKEWILENLKVMHQRYLDRLPGPYTFIFKMKRKVVCEDVAQKTLGVRIPDHPFTKLIQEAGVPFVSTSANMSGETPAWSAMGIPEWIEKFVDIAIHDDILKNPPSNVIDLTKPMPVKIR